MYFGGSSNAIDLSTFIPISTGPDGASPLAIIFTVTFTVLPPSMTKWATPSSNRSAVLFSPLTVNDSTSKPLPSDNPSPGDGRVMVQFTRYGFKWILLSLNSTVAVLPGHMLSGNPFFSTRIIGSLTVVWKNNPIPFPLYAAIEATMLTRIISVIIIRGVFFKKLVIRTRLHLLTL